MAARGAGPVRSFRAVHPFDERFGVETSGLLYELPSGHRTISTTMVTLP